MISVQAAPAAAPVTIRPIEPGDAEAAARVLFDAFAAIHDRHAFPRDFPTLEVAAAAVDSMIVHPAIWGVVAEQDGRVIGSNFLDERGPVRGVGPITVGPAAQAAGVGRRLMEAVLERGAETRSVRLLQDAFNTASLALYASLGFVVREPAVVLAGTVAADPAAGVRVRPLEERDIAACEILHHAVHGYERTLELRDALAAPGLEPTVAVRDGRIVAYAATLAPFAAAHAVAESEEAMAALIGGTLAASGASASFLLPTRQATLLWWALDAGLRVVKPMVYMTVGEYREPAGAWIPSVLY